MPQYLNVHRCIMSSSKVGNLCTVSVHVHFNATPLSTLSWLNIMPVDPTKSLTSNHGGRSHQRMRPLVATPTNQTIPQQRYTFHLMVSEWNYCAVDNIPQLPQAPMESDGVRLNSLIMLHCPYWKMGKLMEICPNFAAPAQSQSEFSKLNRN